VSFAFVESMSDVQFLEGWLIAEYGTAAYYNVAKADWGRSRLFKLPRLEWSVLESRKSGCEYISGYDKKLKSISQKLRQSQQYASELEKELENVRSENTFLSKKVERILHEKQCLSSDIEHLEYELKKSGESENSLIARIAALDEENKRLRSAKSMGSDWETYKKEKSVYAASSLFAGKTS